MGTRKKSASQIAEEELARLDEEISRIPSRGAPNLDPDKLMQSIIPRSRRRRGEEPPSPEFVKAVAEALIARVKKALAEGVIAPVKRARKKDGSG